MRFHLLPVGARFKWRDTLYTKSTPLIAYDDEGTARMVPRSAEVEPLDGQPVAAAETSPLQIDRQRLLDALEALHAPLLARIEARCPTLAQEAEQLLRQGRDALLHTLKD